jgi:hypothetical protein
MVLALRVIRVIGIDAESVGAVGRPLGVPEALNQVPRPLFQDCGRLLERRHPEHVGLCTQHYGPNQPGKNKR